MTSPLDLRASADTRADAEAIRRVLAGDTQAFAEIVQRHQGRLHRYAVSVVLDHDEAADLVQDAFVRAFTSLRACRDHARFPAWLFQTLRHRCLDHLKNVRRRNVRLDDVAPVASTDRPGAQIEREQLRTDLRRALRDLPVLLREAFMMRHVEGLSYETMADLLGASVSALKMRVSRARDTLQTSLGGWQVTEDAAARLSRDAGRLPGVRRGP
jgi:RNA polymerase sigma-70 factor (ECF subfamily)